MAEKIKIAELEIDDKALIASTSKVKKAIDELKKDQKSLKDAGLESSKAFVQNAADLKVLSKAYNVNIKTLASRTQATADAEIRQELLTVALSNEAETIEDLREQNKALNKLRNTSNLLTKEGQEEIEKLNAKLDENNEKIKENADAYLKQKINIGNYKDSIKEAFEELNIFNGGFSGFIQRSKEAGGVGNLVKGSLKGMAQGFLGMTKAALAFIATPIGAILAALVAAFALVKNAMNRSEEATNKLRKVFASVTGVFNTVLKALEPVGEFLIDGIVVGFELAAQAADKAISIISKGLSFLGFDEAAESVDTWRNEIKEGVKDARALADAEANLEKAQRAGAITQLEYQKQAEKLRQIRDDESLTIRERVIANEKLGAVLQEQLDQELRLAEAALLVANLRIKTEGETKEALDAQAEALTTIADIQERITGQESEQLVNRVSLQKEAADLAREAADKAINQQKAELDVFLASQGIKAKGLQEQLKLNEQVYKRETEILEAELANRNITQTEFEAATLEKKNEFLEAQRDLVIENAERELDIYIQTAQAKIDNDQYFSDEALRIEQERLNGIAEKRREFESKRLEEGIINEQAYNDAINEINEENRLALEEADLAREEAQKEKEIIDLENKRLANEENFLLQQEIKGQQLEIQRQQEVEAAEKSGADISLINEKYADRKKVLDQQTQEFKVDLLTGTLGSIRQLAGEETAVGKAAAIAETTINTYKAATAAYSALAGITIVGPVLGAIAAAAAVAGGIANIKKITSTNTKYAKGGIAPIEGARHSGGGVPIYAGSNYIGEAEGGEGIGILSRSAFGGFMDFNNSYSGGRSRQGFMAGGGIITQAVRPQGLSGERESIANAIQGLKVQVAVEDINTGQGNYADVVSGADV